MAVYCNVSVSSSVTLKRDLSVISINIRVVSGYVMSYSWKLCFGKFRTLIKTKRCYDWRSRFENTIITTLYFSPLVTGKTIVYRWIFGPVLYITMFMIQKKHLFKMFFLNNYFLSTGIISLWFINALLYAQYPNNNHLYVDCWKYTFVRSYGSLFNNISSLQLNMCSAF